MKSAFRRLVFLWGVWLFGRAIGETFWAGLTFVFTQHGFAFTHLVAHGIALFFGWLMFNYGRHKKPVRTEIEVNVQADGSLKVFIPKKLPEVSELHSKLGAKMEQAEFRVWISWPERVPMNHDFAQALHSLGNVIEGTGGYLWLSGVRPKDRKMIADHRGPKVDWID